MHLANTFRHTVKKLDLTLTEFAEQTTLANSALTNVLRGDTIRAATFKKLISHPSLAPDEVISLGIAWIEDRRSEIDMDDKDIHIIPSKGETFLRISGDPALVKALRELGIAAMEKKSIYQLVMNLRQSLIE